MGKYRKLLISVLLLAAVAGTAWYVVHRRQGPPEAVRLLPEGELLLYADLRPVHFLDLNQSHPVQMEGEYKQFVDQTGIQIERDLDEVAMSRRNTPNGGDVESAEIFVGRFDAAKLRDYLQQKSTQTERYRDQTIYTIPNEGHMVRVCLLDKTRIAVTNMASVDAIQGIIDRLHGSPPGPSLLADYHDRVPWGSLAWIIDRIPANSDAAQLPEGLSFSFLENTVAVASLRYNGSLLFRADVVAPSEAEARKVLDSVNAFLLVYRSVSSSLGARGNDPDVKSALDSIQAAQKENVVTFTATFSQRFLKKIVSEAQLEGSTAPASPSPSPSPSPRHSGSQRKR